MRHFQISGIKSQTKETNIMRNLNQLEKVSGLGITWEVRDEELNKSETLYFNHSPHSQIRSNERNICNKYISVVIEYGKAFFKQGLIFYVLGENSLPGFLNVEEKEECKNIVVVVSGNSNTILTCYRNNNPFKHIKKKTKTLSPKYYMAS